MTWPLFIARTGFDCYHSFIFTSFINTIISIDTATTSAIFAIDFTFTSYPKMSLSSEPLAITIG